MERLARNWPRIVLFSALVVLPTALCAAYLYLLAAPRYDSEISFVVRSPATSLSNQISSAVQGSSIVRSSDDAYIVQTYMLSRDAMDYLIENAGLMEAFQRPEADLFWRWPPPFRKPSHERLYDHYQRFVDVDYDHSTGVATLTVQAFRPADAQKLADALVRRSEALINGLGERSSADAIASAAAEVQSAETRAQKALDGITEFRNRVQIIDPSQVALAAFNTISALSLQTAEANATLTDVERETPGGPHVDALKRRIAALQDQITVEQKKLAGSSGSLAPQVEEYERLILDQTFAEQAFLSALAALETAKVDAVRQRVFVEPVTSASLPDYPAHPHRLLWTLGCFAVSLMIWRVVRTVLADTIFHGRN